jgi:hypothetical protein
MLAGTVTAAFELVRLTAIPPAGAAAVSVTVAVDDAPPDTLVGESDSAERAGAVVVAPACGVKLRVDENAPKTPAAFRARTRHHS